MKIKIFHRIHTRVAVHNLDVSITFFSFFLDVGVTVLALAKWIMYDFHYDKKKRRGRRHYWWYFD